MPHWLYEITVVLGAISICAHLALLISAPRKE